MFPTDEVAKRHRMLQREARREAEYHEAAARFSQLIDRVINDLSSVSSALRSSYMGTQLVHNVEDLSRPTFNVHALNDLCLARLSNADFIRWQFRGGSITATAFPPDPNHWAPALKGQPTIAILMRNLAQVSQRTLLIGEAEGEILIFVADAGGSDSRDVSYSGDAIRSSIESFLDEFASS